MTEKSTIGARSKYLNITNFRIAFYLILLIYLLIHLVLIWDRSWDNKLFPLMVGVPLTGLLLLQLARLTGPRISNRFATERFTPESNGEGAEGEGTSSLKEVIPVILWTIALPVFIYFVGFVYGPPVYIFAFIFWFTRNLKQAILTTLLFVIFSYLLFVEFLSIRIYHGVFELPNLLRLLQ